MSHAEIVPMFSMQAALGLCRCESDQARMSDQWLGWLLVKYPCCCWTVVEGITIYNSIYRSRPDSRCGPGLVGTPVDGS